MGSPQDKQHLFGLIYDACHALLHEKAEAHQRLNAELDRVRAGTVFSRQQVKDMLYRDGYREFAKRKRIAEHNGI